MSHFAAIKFQRTWNNYLSYPFRNLLRNIPFNLKNENRLLGVKYMDTNIVREWDTGWEWASVLIREKCEESHVGELELLAKAGDI